MNKEQYVKFNTAKLLKKKGFDWPCIFYYDDNGIIHRALDYVRQNDGDDDDNDECLCPTQQMACRWLVKNHNIHIEPHFLRESGDYVYDIIHSPLALDDIHSFPVVFNTIEDAIEAALKYALRNLI